MQRYCGAVYRYFLGAVHDEDAALELFHEFALRFLRGDFRRADPGKGRFRDYLKTSLIHLISDFRRAQRARPLPLPCDVADTAPAALVETDVPTSFAASWREEIVDHAWRALAQARPSLHDVLLLHTEQPGMSSAEMADQLTARAGKSITATNARVMLHRARQEFARFLLEEVEHSLEPCSREELTRELRELNLLTICEQALSRRGH
jgi:RNA polymerase sigma-70 factor (ECF subfamily)